MRAPPEGQVLLGVGAVHPELVGLVEATRVAAGRAVEDHDAGAGSDVDAADGGRRAGQAEVAFHRALEAQALLDEFGDAGGVVAEPLLDVGTLADHLQCGTEQPDGRLLPGGEHVGRHPDHVDRLGQRTVGEAGRGQAGQDVVARLAATLLDVRGQPLVEELEWRMAHGARPRAAQAPARAGDPPPWSSSRNHSWSSSGTPSRSAMT